MRFLVSEDNDLKKNLVMTVMHISVLCGITLFIFQHKTGLGETGELYASYFPLWLVSYEMLSKPHHRGAAIVICILLAVSCLAAAFYLRSYFLIFGFIALCAVFVPLADWQAGSPSRAEG